MSDDQKNLPAKRPVAQNQIARRLEGSVRARQIRDPISGFFHKLESNAATKALQRDTAETIAFTNNMKAQGDATREMMRLRDTADEYQVRDELAGEHYENTKARLADTLAEEAHQRELKRKQREAEQFDADRGVFNAQHGLATQKEGTAPTTQGKRADALLKKKKLESEILHTEAEILELGIAMDEARRGTTTNDDTTTSDDTMLAMAIARRDAAIETGDDAEANRQSTIIELLLQSSKK